MTARTTCCALRPSVPAIKAWCCTALITALVAALVTGPLVGCAGVHPVDDLAPAGEAASTESLRLPDTSGMAWRGEGSYLLVHDAGDPLSPRAALLSVRRNEGPSFTVVPIRDEELAGGHLADLEAIAAIPRRPSEFLALESGGAGDDRAPRRRLVHLRLATAADGGDELLPIAAIDFLPATASLENCEGLACWMHGGELRVLIADRGRVRPRRDRPRVAMVMGSIELADGVAAGSAGVGGDGVGQAAPTMGFTPVAGEEALVLDVPVKASGTWRLCTDLYLDSTGALWGACAQDLGAAGPFRSKVYRAGTIDPDSGWLRLRTARFEHDIDGLKVEALATCELLRADMCFATDDELYGGVWRPLRAAESRSGR